MLIHYYLFGDSCVDHIIIPYSDTQQDAYSKDSTQGVHLYSVDW
jgi:hypothetical protein